MSNDKTITETLSLKVFWLGLGYRCESVDVEDVAGNGKTMQDAIKAFFDAYESKRNVDRQTIQYTVN